MVGVPGAGIDCCMANFMSMKEQVTEKQESRDHSFLGLLPSLPGHSERG